MKKRRVVCVKIDECQVCPVLTHANYYRPAEAPQFSLSLSRLHKSCFKVAPVAPLFHPNEVVFWTLPLVPSCTFCCSLSVTHTNRKEEVRWVSSGQCTAHCEARARTRTLLLIHLKAAAEGRGEGKEREQCE